MNLVTATILIWLGSNVATDDAWALFARVSFKPQFFKEYDQSFLVPDFRSEILSRKGQEITLQGHYMPIEMERNTIVISKFPYAACFFCGGAGPESVAEVVFATKPPKFKVDQVIKVKGKLALNDNDVNHLNFIIQEAVLITP